jgi:hypothetical protein
MGWQQPDLDDYLGRPERAHDSYPSEVRLHARLHALQQRLLVLAGRGQAASTLAAATLGLDDDGSDQPALPT